MVDKAGVSKSVVARFPMNAIQSSAATKIRVLVADNSRIHTHLLSGALGSDPSLEVVSWDWNLSSLIPTALAHNVDVLAISSTLNGHAGQGIEIMRKLRAVRPSTKVVLLLDSQEEKSVVSAFRAGARGIFSRDGSIEMLCKCMHSVHKGEIWAEGREVSMAIDALASTPTVRAVGPDGLNLLTKREVEVVQCLAQGLTNREIAHHMGLSQHTIKNYLFRVFDKLGVSSRVELLFMTLSQSSNPGESLPPEISSKTVERDLHDEATLAFLEKAAERGLPAAQLALAQAYFARRAQPQDLVNAYMWYLIATECTARARTLITRMLSANQIAEAEGKARLRLAGITQASLPASGIKPSKVATHLAASGVP